MTSKGQVKKNPINKLQFTTDILIRRTVDNLIIYLKRFKQQLISSAVFSTEELDENITELKKLSHKMQSIKEEKE